MNEHRSDALFLEIENDSRVVAAASWLPALLGCQDTFVGQLLVPEWLAEQNWKQLLDAPSGSHQSLLLTRADGIGLWAFVRLTRNGDPANFTLSLLPAQQSRQRLEEAHLASQRPYQSWDLVQDAIIQRDEQGRIEYWNAGATRLFGLTADQAVGRNRFQLLYTILPATMTQIVEQLQREGSWSGILSHAHPNGHQVRTAARWVLRRGSGHSSLGVIEVHRDLAGPMLASAETEFFGNLQTALAETSGTEVLAARILPLLATHFGWEAAELWIFDPSSARAQNESLCHRAGYWLGPAVQVYKSHLQLNFRGEPWSRCDFAPHPFWWTNPESSRTARPWKTILTIPMRHAGEDLGTLVFYSVRTCGEDGRLVAQLAQIGFQLGQWLNQRAAEERLRRSEERFRALMESAPDALVITDQRGSILMANRQSERLFGWKREQLIGQNIEILMPGRFRERHQHHRKNYSHHPHTRPMGVGLELAALRADGSEFPVEISLSPIEIDGQTLVASAIRDVTERRHMEQTQRRLHQLEMAQAEHLASLGQLAAGMAHEIKNPLAGIAAALEVLATQQDMPAPALEIMGEVQHQAARIRAIVDELLNYARPRPAELTLADINATVEQAIHFTTIQAQSRGIHIEYDSADLPPLLHDPEQIHRMVLNLLLNALEASPQGGVVRVTIGLAPDGGAILLHVRDYGTGISPADLERIFVPFYTTKGSRGTGLGLSLCRRIAQLHGGTITATSAPNQGSTFVVLLPFRSAAQPAVDNTTLERSEDESSGEELDQDEFDRAEDPHR